MAQKGIQSKYQRHFLMAHARAKLSISIVAYQLFMLQSEHKTHCVRQWLLGLLSNEGKAKALRLVSISEQLC